MHPFYFRFQGKVYEGLYSSIDTGNQIHFTVAPKKKDLFKGLPDSWPVIFHKDNREYPYEYAYPDMSGGKEFIDGMVKGLRDHIYNLEHGLV
ncbi:MAG TPA: hypothetical protein VMI12_19275 [Puia sp.]|nr:hypothetical protein [Puia sp.]